MPSRTVVLVVSSSTNCSSTSFFDGKAHWLSSFRPNSKRRFALTSFTTRFSLHTEIGQKNQLSFRTLEIRRSPVHTIRAQLLVLNINRELLFQIGSEDVVILANHQPFRKNDRSTEAIESDRGAALKNKADLETRSHFAPKDLLYLSGLVLHRLGQQSQKAYTESVLITFPGNTVLIGLHLAKYLPLREPSSLLTLR